MEVHHGSTVWGKLCLIMFVLSSPAFTEAGSLPLVINTWAFTGATDQAWQALTDEGAKSPSLDAVVAGCSACEVMQCDGSVGYGGSPDEAGETTLDALVMDGGTMDVGAVGALRRVKSAVAVARLVLEHTDHSLLVGDQATAFAASMGLPLEDLSTPHSRELWHKWQVKKCQPNFWKDVLPEPGKACGPYEPRGGLIHGTGLGSGSRIGHGSHDTIAMVAIDNRGNVAAGTSTNGASHKIPGRVGDGPIAGASTYADNAVGGCGATGDGDIMMRFLPCYQAVESMRQGVSPKLAAEDAVARIKKHYPDFVGALFAVTKAGEHAGAANGWTFQYSVRVAGEKNAEVHTVHPTDYVTVV